MATTPSKTDTLDTMTTREDALPSEVMSPSVTSVETDGKAEPNPEAEVDATAEVDAAAEARELSEALERADKAVMADEMAKEQATVDTSAFMATPPPCAEPHSPEEATTTSISEVGQEQDELSPVHEQPEQPKQTEQTEQTEQLDAVTGQQTEQVPSNDAGTASIESDLAAEALAVTASMDEEAKKADQEARLARAKKELEAAQEERRAKVEKALAAKPNRIKPEPKPEPKSVPKTRDNTENEPEEEEDPLTLLGHLGELRVRVVRCFIAIGLGFILCYSFAERIFNELMVPLVSAMPPDSKLIFTALPEAFFVYMQVAFVAAVFIVSPYIFYQVWAFISPGLYEEEKKTAIPIAFFSASFFIGGAAFCYFQVFPYAFQFFMGFATDLILPMPSLSEYLSFALKMLIAFGLIFEMPLFAFFLSRVGIVTADMMRKFRKYAVLCMFIVAAILTPPDVFSQTLMAGPMLILYEVSILIAAAVGKKKKDEAEEDESDTEKPKADANSSMQGD